MSLIHQELLKNYPLNMKPVLITFLLLTLCVPFVTCGAEKEKPLTNADVLELIKAGLPESTIISKIQHSETAFDTSTKALVELKGQGVSGPIMDAMLNPAAGQSASPPPMVAPPVMVDFSSVVLIDGTNRIPLKVAVPVGERDRGGTLLSSVFVPIRTDSVTEAIFAGNSAVVRSTDHQPVLEAQVLLPASVEPENILRLIKCKVKSDRRLVEKYRSGVFVDPVKSAKKGYLALTIEQTPLTNSFGTVSTICRAKPSQPLDPGEYFFVNGGSLYDFGVGPAKR